MIYRTEGEGVVINRLSILFDKMLLKTAWKWKKLHRQGDMSWPPPSPHLLADDYNCETNKSKFNHLHHGTFAKFVHNIQTYAHL